MRSLEEIIKGYIKYGIYPQQSLKAHYSPYMVLKNLLEHQCPTYFQELTEMIKKQPEESNRIGADLPYWGEKYFSSLPGPRIMIIAQDSKAIDSGSIVFYAPLIHLNLESSNQYNELFYDKITDFFPDKQRTFRYDSYRHVVDAINDWEINLDFTFITDAKKVYVDSSKQQMKQGIKQEKLFNVTESQDLLNIEIENAQPDFIILLGREPLNIINKINNSKIKYEDVVGKEPFILKNNTYISAPFITGQGRFSPNKATFLERYKKTAYQIKKLLKEKI